MKRWIGIIVIAIMIILLSLVSYGCKSRQVKRGPPKESSPRKKVSVEKILIPAEVLKNKFGFLTGAPRDTKRIKEVRAAWARPHPGPFLWDSMQPAKDKSITFAKTDKLVKGLQEEKIGILATLWPFADWDQKTKPGAQNFKVSEEDEFLADPREKIFRDYLPEYRGNPNDWKAYKAWLRAVVERYDGDGTDDMPGLEIPIKYWEVLNEPDLAGPSPEEEERLRFYKQGPKDYAELLIKTSKIIRSADSSAKILIAGAAGGNSRFLDFYKSVFENQETVAAFDIANVHCISNDDYQSFNVQPYKDMLVRQGIEKPIWVTEAEAVVSDDPDINATQTFNSTKKALELGAEKIFFTRFDFTVSPRSLKPPPGGPQQTDISGKDPIAAYKIITEQN